MIKLCIFDLDGTLIDSLADLAAAMNDALLRQDFPVHPVEKYRQLVGSGLAVLAERAAGAPNDRFTPNVKEQLIDDFNRYYTAHCLDRTRPYAGISALLQALRSKEILCAVNSNKPHAFVRRIVGALFPEQPFADICGKRDGFERKPSPDGANSILQKLNVKPQNAVYIGDSDVDMLTARNAGLPGIGVNWGFRSEQELLQNGASFVAHTTDELLAYLLAL